MQTSWVPHLQYAGFLEGSGLPQLGYWFCFSPMLVACKIKTGEFKMIHQLTVVNIAAAVFMQLLGCLALLTALSGLQVHV
jgi:hypothetical protein